MSQNLFQAAQQAQSQGPKPLVEFKAGRMTYDTNTKTVTADKKKGKIQIVSEENLTRFQWRDREQNNALVDDYVIFPGETKWTRVDKVTSGRVYLLEFNNSTRLKFYWLQEPKTDNDKTLADKVNDLLTNGPGSNSLTQQQQGLMNMLQSQVSSRQSSSSSSNRAPLQIDQLQQIMQNIGMPRSQQQQPSSTQSTTQNQQQQQQPPSASGQAKSISLNQVLSSDAVCAAVQRNGQDFVEKLKEYLPEGNQTSVSKLCEHIRSPQFKQMTSVFNHALTSGQLEGVMPSFGLNPIVGNPYYGGVEPFLNAVQDQENKNNEQQGSSSSDENKKDKKDDEMDTSEQ
ncbi:26S proteasome subunit ADRM1 [Acrasis kona]|uniref:26S proteasome subunit ADRM1 n=1 Tax=Acrasis kona TaxID=1008807 RepID=A0AAW2ZCZ5_9EUKA